MQSKIFFIFCNIERSLKLLLGYEVPTVGGPVFYKARENPYSLTKLIKKKFKKFS